MSENDIIEYIFVSEAVGKYLGQVVNRVVDKDCYSNTLFFIVPL